MSAIYEYFDRISIVHLPERTDRFASLSTELASIGINIGSSKISIPAAPKPTHANGFPSRGVYGNFLSHLKIIEQAYSDNIETVLILEDDAIFSRVFNAKQTTIIENLRSNDWDELFIGHSIQRGLPLTSSGLVRFSGHTLWAHCYGVHRRVMPRLIEYLRQTIDRVSGHPEGGKMYIDGAHNEFRRLNPAVICLISSPCLSVQRGSPSNLGNNAKWYKRTPLWSLIAPPARNIRDGLWRRGLITAQLPRGAKEWVKIESVSPWPS